MSAIKARTRSVMNDGTVVECWHDGTYHRAQVTHEGRAFVRVDTAEAIRAKIPARHVHVLARTTSDVVVFKECRKSASILYAWEILIDGMGGEA